MTVEFSTKYDDRETLNKLSEAIDDPELRERINHLAFNYGLAVGRNSRLEGAVNEAQNCLVCSAIADPFEVCKNTLAILDEVSPQASQEHS